MFLRGRSLAFWAVLVIVLYLLVTRPVEFADFLANAVIGAVGVLRAVGTFFDRLLH
ncbi:hypothetical protein NX801_08850 [Streptomyces sp. LP05-1]|uniref:VanZ family protein n=1 Tax=Streptomyces pyxinae TaxID=2970734 RepID=A0ABT2CED1_9ACTN|nr:hypothetical protein [Streptomyces sp. LP05-1]MCS0635770.1 hypothetical protein [Streptomyces sp. LP05-1]